VTRIHYRIRAALIGAISIVAAATLVACAGDEAAVASASKPESVIVAQATPEDMPEVVIRSSREPKAGEDVIARDEGSRARRL
jgi:hypothetical protein